MAQSDEVFVQMAGNSPQLRGALFMILATASYVVNDTMMKIATAALPPFEILMLRGLAGLFWGLLLAAVLGFGDRLRLMFDGRVLLRNVSEAAANICFIVALSRMPIADATALGQITPLLVLLGAAFVFDERIGRLPMALIGLGLLGALLVIQPTGAGISIYAVLALANAVFSSARDLAGRRVAADVPGIVVAVSAVIVVLAGSTVGHLALENWVMPSAASLGLLAGAGFFLVAGHFFIFMAYRTGRVDAVAPFYYCFTLWAVISGLVVFGYLPNTLAIVGIALVVASGCAIVALDNRNRRRTLSAGPGGSNQSESAV